MKNWTRNSYGSLLWVLLLALVALGPLGTGGGLAPFSLPQSLTMTDGVRLQGSDGVTQAFVDAIEPYEGHTVSQGLSSKAARAPASRQGATAVYGGSHRGEWRELYDYGPQGVQRVRLQHRTPEGVWRTFQERWVQGDTFQEIKSEL